MRPTKVCIWDWQPTYWQLECGFGFRVSQRIARYSNMTRNPYKTDGIAAYNEFMYLVTDVQNYGVM
jgi:hypothetical protein